MEGLAVFVRRLAQAMGVLCDLEPKPSLCEVSRPTEESDHSLDLHGAVSLSKQLQGQRMSHIKNITHGFFSQYLPECFLHFTEGETKNQGIVFA